MTEADLFLAKADLTAQSGSGGKDLKRLADAGRELMRDLAAAEPDTKRQRSYLEAKCSSKWVRSLLNDQKGVIAEECGMRKVSDLSDKRARVPRIQCTQH